MQPSVLDVHMRSGGWSVGSWCVVQLQLYFAAVWGCHFWFYFRPRTYIFRSAGIDNGAAWEASDSSPECPFVWFRVGLRTGFHLLRVFLTWHGDDLQRRSPYEAQDSRVSRTRLWSGRPGDHCFPPLLQCLSSQASGCTAR